MGPCLPFTGTIAWALLLDRLWHIEPWAQILAGVVGLCALVWWSGSIIALWRIQDVNVPEEIARLDKAIADVRVKALEERLK